MRYKQNREFFKNIDSKDKAYILGLLYADGCNFIKGTRYKVSLVLHLKDKYLLEDINNLIGSERPLQVSYNTSILHLSGKEYSDDLTKLGCMAKKSLILEFPTKEQVPEEFLPDFIRGYFDGDGCIGISNNYLRVTIIGTEKFLLSLSDYLISKGIDSKIYKQQSQKVYSLKVLRKDSVISFRNLIYDKAQLKLSRKYEKFLTLKFYNY